MGMTEAQKQWQRNMDAMQMDDCTYHFVVFFRSSRATEALPINKITLEDCLGIQKRPQHDIVSIPRNWDTVWE